jgi:hypothetical protein
MTPLTYDEWSEMQEIGAGLPHPLTMRQRDVLSSLVDHPRSTWLRPMDIGGRDGSHHSDTLRQLVAMGLVERKKLHAIYCYHGTHHAIGRDGKIVRLRKPNQRCCCKGSCRYRATPRARKIYARAVARSSPRSRA